LEQVGAAGRFGGLTHGENDEDFGIAGGEVGEAVGDAGRLRRTVGADVGVLRADEAFVGGGDGGERAAGDDDHQMLFTRPLAERNGLAGGVGEWHVQELSGGDLVEVGLPLLLGDFACPLILGDDLLIDVIGRDDQGHA
jgi:hypothetical protein